MGRLAALHEAGERDPSLPLPCVDPAEGGHPHVGRGALIEPHGAGPPSLTLPASRTGGNELLLCEPPSPWGFVTAAELTETHSPKDLMGALISELVRNTSVNVDERFLWAATGVN